MFVLLAAKPHRPYSPRTPWCTCWDAPPQMADPSRQPSLAPWRVAKRHCGIPGQFCSVSLRAVVHLSTLRFNPPPCVLGLHLFTRRSIFADATFAYIYKVLHFFAVGWSLCLHILCTITLNSPPSLYRVVLRCVLRSLTFLSSVLFAALSFAAEAVLKAAARAFLVR